MWPKFKINKKKHFFLLYNVGVQEFPHMYSCKNTLLLTCIQQFKYGILYLSVIWKGVWGQNLKEKVFMLTYILSLFWREQGVKSDSGRTYYPRKMIYYQNSSLFSILPTWSFLPAPYERKVPGMQLISVLRITRFLFANCREWTVLVI